LPAAVFGEFEELWIKFILKRFTQHKIQQEQASLGSDGKVSRVAYDSDGFAFALLFIIAAKHNVPFRETELMQLRFGEGDHRSKLQSLSSQIAKLYAELGKESGLEPPTKQQLSRAFVRRYTNRDLGL